MSGLGENCNTLDSMARDKRLITLEVRARWLSFLPWPKRTFLAEKVTTRDYAAQVCEKLREIGAEVEIIGDEAV